MTRQVFIEMALRQIYGGFPTDDSEITFNLVNTWLEQATAIAAKQNYKDNISIEGIGYVNGSFYTKFTDIAITDDGNFTWKINLPSIPLGIGRNEGISTLQLVDTNGRVTNPFIPISEQQRTYFQSMRPIPNKVLYYNQNKFVYAITTILLNDYTANVVMVSAGDSTDLSSELNVPADYFPVMVEYIKQQLMFERQVPVDTQNDGLDATKTV